jgi:hypothetical protein
MEVPLDILTTTVGGKAQTLSKSTEFPLATKSSSLSKKNENAEVSPQNEIIISNDEIMKFFHDALSTKSEEMKFLLDSTALISMSDLGGQPEFMDMQPALVLGPALYLIFCNLMHNLQDYYPISYLKSSGGSTIPVQSVYTVEEMIFQALSSVACLGTTTPHEKPSDGSAKSLDSEAVVSNTSTLTEGVSNLTLAASTVPLTNSASPGVDNLPLAAGLTPSKSKALIVATHKDCVSDDRVKKFDADLQRKIRTTDFFREDLVQFISKERLILDVNNKSGGVEEVRKIQKIIEKQIHHSFKKLRIPISWFIFSLCLQKLKPSRMVSLQSCLNLAKQLNIPLDEARLAIWFLHHYAGLLMHFPDLPELCDSVICDTQMVHDSVTHLIVNTFRFDNVSKVASEIFNKTGQFNLKDITEAIDMVGSPKDCIPCDKLVKLLEYLNIIARVPQPSTSTECAAISKTVYFMPCVLQNAESSELKVDRNEKSPPPLMIRFTCGFIPIGVFTAMIANLAGQSSLRILFEGIKKNRVQFYYKRSFDTLTIICKSKHYEIHILRRPTAKTSTRDVCAAIRCLIQQTLKDVTSHFHYGFSLSYELAFECPEHKGDDHLCVVQAIGNTEPEVMLCLQKDVPITMQDQHLAWFGEVSLHAWGQGGQYNFHIACVDDKMAA